MDPPASEDCPICFLPMPSIVFMCASLPDATISSVPIYDFEIANEGLRDEDMEQYYSCCDGKTICRGCVHSTYMSLETGASVRFAMPTLVTYIG
jgi:hypothetical protein